MESTYSRDTRFSVAQQNLEIVRSVYDRWRTGDFLSGADIFDSALVYVIRPEFPDAGTYAGLEQVASFIQSWLEPWERVTIEAEEFREAGDSVLVAVHQVGVGRGSGVPGDMRFFQIWTFRAGRVIRLDAIRDRRDALEAVGLME